MSCTRADILFTTDLLELPASYSTGCTRGHYYSTLSGLAVAYLTISLFDF